MVSKLPAALSGFPIVPEKISEEKNVEVAEVNQWHCLEESGQSLENVDQTHLGLGIFNLPQKHSGITPRQVSVILASHDHTFDSFWQNVA